MIVQRTNPQLTDRPRLVLASRSPRRVELLEQAGFTFTVYPADIDESDYPLGTLPPDVALHLAKQKASTVALKFPRDVVLAADTIVAFGDYILGKPLDAEHAHRMLELLSGTTHLVITGVAIAQHATSLLLAKRVMSSVRMRALTAEEIGRYVKSDLWQGKAGAYGIQDRDPFVERVSGCHTNVVGLPMTTTKAMLAQVGFGTPAPAAGQGESA
jgi:septum formation protein